MAVVHLGVAPVAAGFDPPTCAAEIVRQVTSWLVCAEPQQAECLKKQCVEIGGQTLIILTAVMTGRCCGSFSEEVILTFLQMCILLAALIVVQSSSMFTDRSYL